MKLIKTGSTRRVLLIGKYAIKFPNVYSFRNFLQGILCNEQEFQWSKKLSCKKLCPVIWKSWFYLIIIMPRADVLNEYEFMDLRCTIEYFRWMDDNYNGIIPAELKADSWGWLNCNLVAIDYGS